MMHTPGPWVVGGPWPKISICQPEEDGDPWNFVLWVWDDLVVQAPDEVKANAALIAAAPELLEACETALAYLDKLDTPLCFCGDDPNCPECRTTDKLEKAISKAKGTQP